MGCSLVDSLPPFLICLILVIISDRTPLFSISVSAPVGDWELYGAALKNRSLVQFVEGCDVVVKIIIGATSYTPP